MLTHYLGDFSALFARTYIQIIQKLLADCGHSVCVLSVLSHSLSLLAVLNLRPDYLSVLMLPLIVAWNPRNPGLPAGWVPVVYVVRINIGVLGALSTVLYLRYLLLFCLFCSYERDQMA
jgi:hypothetical protein